MKQQHFIIEVLLVLLVGGLVSCSESEPYVVCLEKHEKQFDASMEITNYKAAGDYWWLDVKAYDSQSWTIRRDYYDSWVHLGDRSNTSSTYYGYSMKSVCIYVDENMGYSRSAVLTVTNGSGTKTITIAITQEETQFGASMETTNYKAAGDYWWLDVKADDSQSWTIRRDYFDSWVHFGSSYNTSLTYNGSGEKSVRIYVDKNTGSKRSATLTVTSGLTTRTITITITQDAAY